MGLQILPADISPPARIRDSSAQHPPPAELTSRFDGYLNDARSAVDTEPAARTTEAPRADAEPPTDVDEIDAETAPSADQAEETTDHQPTVTVAPPVAVGPDVSNLTPIAVEPPAESSPSAQRQPTAITPNPSAETTEQGPSQPAPADSPQQVATPLQDAKVSGQNVEPLVNQDTRSAPTSETAAQSGRTATKTMSEPLHLAGDPPGVSSRQPQQPTNLTPVQGLPPDQSRARQEADDANQPRSPQLPNPRLAATQRGALDSPPPSPQETLNLRIATTQRGAPASPTPIPVPKHVTLKAGKGDAAAAAFAKFLITAANHTGTGSTSNTAAPMSAGGIGQAAGNATPAAVANQAPVADLVADLLAARVDGADAIKGAARVLNASGRSGKFEVTMQLDPPELGQLKLQIQMRQQGLTLRVDAQTQAVAKLIESRLVELSDALAMHGIRVDRAEVTVRSTGSTQADAKSTQDNGPTNHGDFNQASTQDQDGSDQGEAAPHQTADRQLNDPKHPVEDHDGGPYQDDLTALAGLGADANDATIPATELSVNLVA